MTGHAAQRVGALGGTPGRRSLVGCALLLGGVAALGGCVNPGAAPPDGELNFPLDLTLGPRDLEGSADTLFVVNSNFNLRYNTATLLALDLDEIHREIDDCEAEGLLDDNTCVLAPLPGDLAESPALLDEVGISTLTDGLALGSPAANGAPSATRIYLAARADQNLNFVDFTGQAFSCDQELPTQSSAVIPICGERFRTTDVSPRDTELMGDPVDVLTAPLRSLGVDREGDAIVLTLREGSLALFVDDGGPEDRPRLLSTVDVGVDDLVTSTLEPDTGLVWVASADSSALIQVGVFLDPLDLDLSFLSLEGTVDLRDAGADDGDDTRQILFEPDSTRLWALNRRPEAVFGLDQGVPPPQFGGVTLYKVFEVALGPSRMAIGTLGGRDYLFVTSFQAQRLFVIDLDLGDLVAVVGGLSGPFGVLVDEARQYVYLTDFASSVIRFIDVAPLTETRTPVRRARLGPIQTVQFLGNN